METFSKEETALLLAGLECVRLETTRQRHKLGTIGTAEALEGVRALTARVEALQTASKVK